MAYLLLIDTFLHGMYFCILLSFAMSTKLNNGLFMGDVDAAQDADFISLNGIQFILNCVPLEVPNVFENDGIK